MAPLQDVYEYLQVRDKSVISTSLTGNTLQIVVDRSNIPDNLLKNALSLVINANSNIVSVVSNQPLELSFNGTASAKLINLEWDVNNFKSGGQVNTKTWIQSDSESGEDEITVYPNPAHDLITVSSQTQMTGQIEIISPTAGFILRNEVMAQQSFDIKLSELSNGIYIIRYLSVDGKILSKKFVKQ
jgi:hypothetical protein